MTNSTRMSFNSLQTGKHIQRTKEKEKEEKKEEEFQFPSNGKAYPKTIMGIIVVWPFRTVSIPFKRESISKGKRKTVGPGGQSQGFNSLQTGKHIQSHFSFMSRSNGYNGFNSLQTGKHIQRHNACHESNWPRVSIPFKRESISKERLVRKQPGPGYWFQFPSNGKAYPKSILAGGMTNLTRVSIPFKRESISKGLVSGKYTITYNEFQFPSNGKAYPKDNNEYGAHIANVSIPFKRESISKEYSSEDCCFYTKCFNSLQTGKHIQSREAAGGGTRKRRKFQFPSNGKAYPKDRVAMSSNAVFTCVSIPFKRESISKAGLLPASVSKALLGFNSLQTGKHIQRDILNDEARAAIIGFQFPSNGKAYPKLAEAQADALRAKSFNSLQTGKHIQREWNAEYDQGAIGFCFNSLQTGKHIQRWTLNSRLIS